ncbi:hypothetical protein D3C80_1613600 [compost metagenome]
MHRRDGRLQAIGPESPHTQRVLDQRAAFSDQPGVPQRTVLLVEHNQLAARRSPGRAPRLVQQHQRQQAHHLRLRQQLHQ